MKYRVGHTTAYRYVDEVSSSYGQVHLLARRAVGQTCEKSIVEIDPPPDDYRERDDFFGNRVAYFEILSPHRRLSVQTTSWVDVEADARADVLAAAAAAPAGDGAQVGGSPWEEARPAEGAGTEYLLESPLVAASPELEAYARTSFQPGRPIVDALADLGERIHDEFRYRPGATMVSTTAAEALARGEGVCQDFAHLAIGCLRSLGLPARYVSGYLETDPPVGRPRLAGADVSHAWASVLVPGAGWIDIDPTNRQFVNGRYVVAAWGRDYTDVPPLKGVIFTEGTTHDLEVSVDVVRLDG
jgi:transglutaminase-like putative cysteine protease